MSKFYSYLDDFSLITIIVPTSYSENDIPGFKVVGNEEEIELEIYQGNTPGTDQSDTTEYYQSHELVDYYKINEDLELYEVKFDHEFQLSGLNSVYLVKKDTILLNLGGLNSLVSVKYYNDTSIYLYERGLMLQYTPNINKIHQVDYDGNIIKSSLIICDSYNNETGHRLILDGNNIVKLYLP